MTQPPLISVIVPVHNVAAHVAACLHSLRAQTLADFECLVIDDGSTDGSGDLAAQAIAGDARFRLITQPNRGLSGARNTGLDAARGAFIAFVDSDDRVMPDYLMRLWQVLDDSGAGWVSCALRSVHADGTGHTHSTIHSAPDLTLHTVPRRYRFDSWDDVTGHFPSAWNKLYRASLIAGLRFDEGTWFEDHAFYQRAAARTDHLMYLPEPLYLQTRGRPGQITGADDDRVFEQFSVLDTLRGLLDDTVRPGGAAAFQRLATRLIFERSTQVRDPVRRARFAQGAAQFLQQQGLIYAPGQDDDVGRTWGLELAGHLPLTVIVQWDGDSVDALEQTLISLQAQPGPGHEVLVLCPATAMARAQDICARHPAVQLLPWSDAQSGAQSSAQSGAQPDTQGAARGLARALVLARGRYLACLEAGTKVLPGGLARAVEALVRTQTDLAVTAVQTADDIIRYAFGDGGPVGGPLAPRTDLLARLTVPAQAVVIRRAFALQQSLTLPDILRDDGDFARAVWAAGAGLVHLPAPCLAFAAEPAPRSTAAAPRDAVKAPKASLSFVVSGDAALRYRANFDDGGYANLYCADAAGLSVPFHLSLRLAEQQLVWNTRNGPVHWGAERALSLHVPRAGAEITLRLRDGGLTVWVDGTERLVLSQADVPDLGRIARLETEGTIHFLDLLPQMPGPGPALDDRLRLRQWGLDDCGPLILQGAGPDITLPVTRWTAAPDETGPEVALPGRIWRGLPAGQALTLRLGTSTPLTLTRADMAGHITRVLERDPPLADTALALALLEHLRDADLRAHVPPAALMRAMALARRYGLGDQIAGADTAALLQKPGTDPDIAAIDAAVARFADSQRHSPAPDPLAVLDGLALHSARAQQGLFLALSEVFCRDDHDTDGFIARARALPAFHPRGEVWSDSAMLPFLCDRAAPEVVIDVLQSLLPPTDGWVLTAPLAWVLRDAVQGGYLPGEARELAILSIMDYVEKRLTEYWERPHCAQLTRAAAALVINRDRLPPRSAERLERFCLRAYGLSHLFWDVLDRSGAVLPIRLARARTDFAALLQAVQNRDLSQTDTQLAVFESYATPDAARWRIDLLGPSGVSPDSAPGLARHPKPQLAALRQAAFPGPPPAPAVTALARTALPEMYPEVPRSPHLAQQRALSQAATALMADPDNAPSWQALTDAAQPLTDADSGWLGVAIPLALIAHMPPQHGGRIWDWLTPRLDRLNDTARRALARAPALLGPLRDLPQNRHGPVQAMLPDAVIPDLPDTPDLPAPHPVHDVIVVVFSCQAYLPDRLPALRAGWLDRLTALGVPWIVVVGDGDGRRDGHVVHLDAPDDYEGLPQKTLAAIDWVQRNTKHGHMFKVDDDCFVNVDLFIQSLTWRKSHYHGRKLLRVPGQTDRVWHQPKSSSDRGRLEFDTSPEPSTYADGGSGYTLSRAGMAAALKAAQSPAGQRLIHASFMEDKLLGDLLALRGIAVDSTDYRIAIRRKTHHGGRPVSSWLNSFLPSQTAPLMLAHLDSPDDQGMAAAQINTDTLRPHKIWPSYQPVKLGYRSNALDLISPRARVDLAHQAPVALVACLRNEMFMLPHFLAHYRRLGIGAFVIADNGSDDGTFEYLEAQPDVVLFSVDTDYNQSRYGVAWQQALLAAFRVGRWSLVADADEFLVWQENQTQTLPDLLADPGFEGADAARVFMLDMYPQGPLEYATFASGDPFAEAGFADRVPFLTRTPMTGPFSDAPAWTSALRHRLIPGSRPNLFTAQKLALLRYGPWMQLSAGMHFIGNARLARRALIFAHFKYNADFRRKAETEVARGQHFNDAEEYRKYLALTQEGRRVIYDADLSAPWAKVPFVRDRLG